MKRVHPLRVLLVFACLLVTQQASAQTTTSYPGLFCVADVNWPDISHTIVSTILMPDGPTSLLCPVVQHGKDIVSAQVVVNDVDPTAGISCRALATNSDNSITFFTPTVSTTAAFQGKTTLTLGAATGFQSFGVKVVRCSMPKQIFNDTGCAVLSYSIVES